MRIAGPAAASVAQQLLDRADPLVPRHATYARVKARLRGPGASKVVDQVVVTWFQAPQSYTGDDVVELSGHGSPVLMEQIVALAMEAGARLAEPGEFTLRAYLNGRLDLTQAEAVADLVEAVTPLQARAAMDQLEGTLTHAIGAIDARLFDLAARLEASLDFPEEGFHFITRDETIAILGEVREAVAVLVEQGRTGRVIREGRTVVIAGRPNAGKSSLFNRLVGAARAIVTEVPGTTRDLLTERVDIDGIPITLVDTAGLREGGDAVEVEGVARARQAQGVASLMLAVVDGSIVPADHALDWICQGAKGPRLIVLSKADRPAAWNPDAGVLGGAAAIRVSAVSGEGIDELRRAMVTALTGTEALRDLPRLTNVRHLALADRALTSVAEAGEALAAGASEEVVLAELGAARRALEEITGRRTPEDLLRHIFARFCVGK